MHIAIGSDHAGFTLKGKSIEMLKAHGYEVLDVGTFSSDPADYPDQAEAVGRTLMEGKVERGILICGSGIGASIAANKIPGIRAGLCHDLFTARQGVEDDDMNILVLGARTIQADLAMDVIQTFLQASFSNAERHVRRLNKVLALEQRYR